MKELIRHILKEETSIQRKLKDSIEDIGIYKTSKKVGGMKNLLKIIGDKFFTRNKKIEIIKELVEHYYSDGYIDLWMVDIVINSNEKYLEVIEILNPNHVAVFSYEKPNYEESYDDDVYYEELSNKIIDEIFNEVVNHYTN